MELLKVYAALLRRKWLFLQAIVFFTISAGVLALVLPKSYEATSKISVESSDASLSILGEMDLGEMASSLSGSSDDMETKIALAKMRPVLDEVVWKLQLRGTDGELLSAEKLLAPGIDGEILAMPYIEIEQEQGTNILAVKGVSNFPELSALLADTLVQVYLDSSVKSAKQETQDALQFITTELVRLQGEFDDALRNLADAQQAEAVIDLDSELKAAVSRVSELLMEKDSIQGQIVDTRAQIRELKDQAQAENVAMISPSTVSSNRLISTLREQRDTLVLKRRQELFDKTAKHPDILLLDEQIKAVDDQIAAALEEDHTLDPAVQNLEVQLAGLQRRHTEIMTSIDQTIQEFGVYPGKMRRIAQLQLAADATETVYQALLEQQYQIAVADAMTVADMKSVEVAKIPDVPAAPKLLVYIVLGCFVGVGVGLGLVFLVEYIDDSIKSQEDLKQVWSIPVLGIIPRFKLKSGGRLIHELPATDPLFEAYRAVRSGIAFASIDAPINVLTVTSCAPGEGKSTFTTNLGICLAQDGARVLIVDCDMRLPTQNRMFNTLSNQVGVSSVLSQSVSRADAIQQTPVANLYVMTSGPLPTNPGRMVESLRLRQLLQELSREYDMILVDAPPILAVGDALALGRASKGTVVVLEAGKTTRRMITDLKSRVDGSGVEVTGLVFNKVDVRSTNGYGYYGQYARHYNRTAKERQSGEAAG